MPCTSFKFPDFTSLQIFSELEILKRLKLEASFQIRRELKRNMKRSGCCKQHSLFMNLSDLDISRSHSKVQRRMWNLLQASDSGWAS
jgi:hypothetical protein